MHPALSVIFFTTLSGAGYGLLFWAASARCWAVSRATPARVMLLAIVLSTIGLLSSLLHLGKPRARGARSRNGARRGCRAKASRRW
jgi:DMSO reductase anchor subunit